mmetsp:Transcript_1656/g.5882  ORF Transcript_1656/g.5882 Transcript_1656/m.5882 type:complete len:211 (+) Transcript_1656:210-842(+)
MFCSRTPWSTRTRTAIMPAAPVPTMGSIRSTTRSWMSIGSEQSIISGSRVLGLCWMRIFPIRTSMHTSRSALSMLSPALMMDTPHIGTSRSLPTYLCPPGVFTTSSSNSSSERACSMMRRDRRVVTNVKRSRGVVWSRSSVCMAWIWSVSGSRDRFSGCSESSKELRSSRRTPPRCCSFMRMCCATKSMATELSLQLGMMMSATRFVGAM